MEGKGDWVPGNDYGTRGVQDRERKSRRSDKVVNIPRGKEYAEVPRLSKLL